MKPQKEKQRNKEETINQKGNFNMAINTYWSMITLKVNGLNAPVKRHRVEDWIQKKSAYNILPVQRPSSGQRTHID